MKKLTLVGDTLTMLLPMLCVLALVSVLSGCSVKVGGGIEAACGQWDPIYASKVDSLETVEQIYMNNVKQEAFCDGV